MSAGSAATSSPGTTERAGQLRRRLGGRPDPRAVRRAAGPDLRRRRPGTITNVVRTTVARAAATPTGLRATRARTDVADVEVSKTGPATALAGRHGRRTRCSRANLGPDARDGRGRQRPAPGRVHARPGVDDRHASSAVSCPGTSARSPPGQVVACRSPGVGHGRAAGSTLVNVASATSSTPDPCRPNNDGSRRGEPVDRRWSSATPPPLNQPPVAARPRASTRSPARWCRDASRRPTPTLGAGAHVHAARRRRRTAPRRPQPERRVRLHVATPTSPGSTRSTFQVCDNAVAHRRATRAPSRSTSARAPRTTSRRPSQATPVTRAGPRQRHATAPRSTRGRRDRAAERDRRASTRRPAARPTRPAAASPASTRSRTGSARRREPTFCDTAVVTVTVARAQRPADHRAAHRWSRPRASPVTGDAGRRRPERRRRLTRLRASRHARAPRSSRPTGRRRTRRRAGFAGRDFIRRVRRATTGCRSCARRRGSTVEVFPVARAGHRDDHRRAPRSTSTSGERRWASSGRPTARPSPRRERDRDVHRERRALRPGGRVHGDRHVHLLDLRDDGAGPVLDDDGHGRRERRGAARAAEPRAARRPGPQPAPAPGTGDGGAALAPTGAEPAPVVLLGSRAPAGRRRARPRAHGAARSRSVRSAPGAPYGGRGSRRAWLRWADDARARPVDRARRGVAARGLDRGAGGVPGAGHDPGLRGRRTPGTRRRRPFDALARPAPAAGAGGLVLVVRRGAPAVVGAVLVGRRAGGLPGARVRARARPSCRSGFVVVALGATRRRALSWGAGTAGAVAVAVLARAPGRAERRSTRRSRSPGWRSRCCWARAPAGRRERMQALRAARRVARGVGRRGRAAAHRPRAARRARPLAVGDHGAGRRRAAPHGPRARGRPTGARRDPRRQPRRARRGARGARRAARGRRGAARAGRGGGLGDARRPRAGRRPHGRRRRARRRRCPELRRARRCTARCRRR